MRQVEGAKRHSGVGRYEIFISFSLQVGSIPTAPHRVRTAQAVVSWLFKVLIILLLLLGGSTPPLTTEAMTDSGQWYLLTF